ncbi:MAG: hypothetical protein FJ290_19735 [Planctomycetes bacterium]|nr:hypothetical protein [Planctomycetota bacterium]
MDTVPFDPDRVTVQEVGGRWFVMTDEATLLSFERDEAGARRALEVIRFYRMNQQCSIGRPTPLLQYYMVSDRPPDGPMQGEVAVPLDLKRLDVAQVDERWLLVQGNVWLLDFGAAEAEARAAVAVIRNAGFTHMCFVGRPRPTMIYFRTGGAAAQVQYVQAALAADTPCYSGPLPARLRFRGSITVGQPCEVQYTFLRSDGVQGPVYALRFLQAGAAEVNTEVVVAQEGQGWVALSILAPVVTQSAAAVYEVRPPALPVVRASVVAQPMVYAGRLPATIRFRGRIFVGQACDVQYAFVRSNGTTGPVQALRFADRGAAEVFDEWTLFRNCVGWAAIQILAPVEAASNQAPFEVRSEGHHRIQADLSAVPSLYSGPLPAPIELRGLIAVSRPCEVEYLFMRSDNTMTPVQRLRFDRPGARGVAIRWDVPWEGAGWATLRIVRPVQIESERATFEVRSPAQPHVRASLVADPPHHPGPLPATVRFRGTIWAGQPGDVTYVFLRSDGSASPPQTLHFHHRGARAVEDAWTLARDYAGWEIIRVVAPVRVDSDRADFVVKAQAPPVKIDVGLAVEPPAYAGPPPAFVQCKAIIRASRACDVRYTFTRSGSPPSEPRLLRFDRPDAKEVVFPMRFTHDFHGWASVQILAPVQIESARVPIRVDIRVPPRIRVSLAADPAVHPGPLPATVRFLGTIAVDQPGEVRYTFMRHDGTTERERVLRFDAPGSREVASQVTLDRPGTGWQVLRIVAPVALDSERAAYEVKPGPPPLGIQATLAAEPPAYKGPVPGIIVFRGIIKVSRPCDVQYRFEHSDGTQSPPQSARLPRPGPHAVEVARQFVADAKGWAILRILAPVAAESNKADFTVDIEKPLHVQASVEAVPPKYVGPAPGTIRFRGVIKVGQPCDVAYAFAYGDGTETPRRTARLDRPGIHEVEDIRQFKADTKGWAMLRIFAPVALDSERAGYEVNVAAPPPPVGIQAALAAEPPAYKGPGPAKIVFRGVIKANRPCDVQYRFEHSDGTQSAPQTVRLARPGPHAVEEARQFAADAKGWAILRILAPVAAESNRADFTVDIEKPLHVQASVQAVPPKYDGPAPGTIRFRGVIKAGQPCDVRYAFAYGDGTTSPPQTVRFDRPGVQQVEDVRQFAADAKGWAQLRIQAPAAVDSDREPFEVNIREAVKLDARLQAVPPKYVGPPPAAIQFKGTIRANQPCDVRYAFVRSEGGPTPQRTLRFDRPGAQDVEFDLKLMREGAGWVMLQVTAPVPAESERAAYEVKFQRPEAKVTAELTLDPPAYAGPPPATIECKGVIRADQPCAVQYVFLRDGAPAAPPRTLRFDAPGAQEVRLPLRFAQDYKGTVQLRVLAPAAESPQVPLTVDIRERPKEKEKEKEPPKAKEPPKVKEPPAAVQIQATIAVESDRPPGGKGFPGVVRFKGTIRASGPCEVKYVFLHSDNSTSPERTIRFTAAGEQAVTDLWRAGPGASGWALLRILEPVKVDSDRAPFDLKRPGR